MIGNSVAVIGQGYVGLPLAMSLANLDYKVVGIDINKEKISSLNKGKSLIEDVADKDLLMALRNGRYKATSDFSKVASSEIVIICVPTPLDLDLKPDLSLLISALISISEHLKQNTLIILESTVAPGTTRGLVAKTIEDITGHPISDFNLAFSPERIDPKNAKWNVSNTPKLVAGLTSKSCELATKFYSSIVSKVVQCESLEVAESAKLLENSFRLINISFINEFSMFCDKLGIDTNSVIEAAATKPYGFMPFYPSIGVGGHCIPVDPLYLSSKAKEIGAPTKFIDLAIQTNLLRPSTFVDKAEQVLGELKAKRILVVGVSYKPNVADVRETPAKDLIIALENRGAQVFWHDELVQEWNGSKSADLDSSYDLAIIAICHNYINLDLLKGTPMINSSGSIS